MLRIGVVIGGNEAWFWTMFLVQQPKTVQAANGIYRKGRQQSQKTRPT